MEFYNPFPAAFFAIRRGGQILHYLSCINLMKYYIQAEKAINLTFAKTHGGHFVNRHSLLSIKFSLARIHDESG